MAEGLSLAANIIAVFDLSLKVIKYARDVKDAPAEQSRLLQDVKNIKSSLLSLQKHLKSAKPNDPWMREVQELNDPGGPVAICKATLDQLLNKLNPPDGPRKRKTLSKFGSSLAWPFRAGEVAAAMATIERQQRLFKIAMEHDANALRRAIKVDVEDNKQLLRAMTTDMKETKTEVHDILERSRSDTERKVLEWLSTMQPQKDHYDISSRRTSGTGEWVKNTAQFQDWLSDDTGSNVVWCSGIPGSGKTFVASLIIDHLRKISAQDQAKVAYVYCDYKSYEKEKDPQRNFTNIVGAILGRFMSRVERLPAALINLFHQSSMVGDMVRLTQLEAILLDFCNAHTTYIVIDALDESGHSSNRRPLLNFLGKLEATKAKLFYTTRPDQKDIERHLNTRPHIRIEASELDIINFLNEQIKLREEEEDLEELLTQDLKQDILSTLLERAHGMFLLPSLQIRAVLEQLSEANIRQALIDLPAELDEQFEATMQRIRSQPETRQNLALRTLMWLGHSAEIDMNTAMLQHALGVEVGDTDLDHSKLTPLSLLKNSIVDFCLGLVSIHKDTSEIRLVHFTLHDFLYNPNSTWYTTSELLLAEVCLTYLLFNAFDSPPPAEEESYYEMRRLYPLYEIACLRWGLHVHRLMHHNMMTKVGPLIIRLLDSYWQRLRAAQGWFVGTYRTTEDLFHQPPLEMTPVHFGAQFGLPDIVQIYVKEGVDINEQVRSTNLQGWTASFFVALNTIGDQCGSWMVKVAKEQGADFDGRLELTGRVSPLYFAIQHGRSQTLKAFLTYGADPDIFDNLGYGPLHYAAQYGQVSATRHLLESGCKVSPKIAGTSATPLHIAIDEAEHEIVQLLLQYEADIEACDSIEERPLHIAARRGHLATIGQLQDRGASLEVENKYGETPIITAAGTNAAAQNNGETVRALIKYGAHVNGGTRTGDTALTYAARQGNRGAVKPLIDAGADLHVANEDNETALHAAVESGDAVIVQILLTAGAKPNRKTVNDLAPLHLAIRNEDVTRVLLEHGAEVDCLTSISETPLHLCSRGESDVTRVVDLLLKHGANIESVNAEGRTPLHYAVRWGKIETIESLIQRGASMSARTLIGQWPLHLAVLNDSSIVQFLLDKGCSVEGKTYKRTMALHVAAMANAPEIARLLLQQGTKIDSQDDEGCSALHITACYGHDELTSLLLHHGADLELKRSNGMTALHTAAANNNDEAANILIEAGADIEALEDDTFTPLVIACELGHVATVRQLIDQGANIDAYTTLERIDGWSSLVFAAQNGHMGVITLLLDKNIDTGNCRGNWTALHAAIRNQHLSLVRALLDSGGFDIEAKAIAATPLQLAILNSDVNMVRLLLDQGAHTETRSDDGSTAISFAVWRDTDEAAVIFHILKDEGADLLARDNKGIGCLHLATELASSELLETLLKYGLDVNATAREGFRPLHWAASKDRTQNAQLLLDAYADVDATDDNGYTPLHFACEKGFEEIAKLLLDNGASMTPTSLDAGHNPLLRATIRSHIPVIRLLLETGANVNVQDTTGASVLHWAVTKAVDLDDSIKEDLLAEKQAEIVKELESAEDEPGEVVTDRQDASIRNESTTLSLDPETSSADVIIPFKAIEAELTRRIATLELILSYGPDPNLHENGQSDTPLHAAAYASSAPILTLLLNAGADPMATNNQDSTALHIVIYSNNASVMDCLTAICDYSVYETDNSDHCESMADAIAHANRLPSARRREVLQFLKSHMENWGWDKEYRGLEEIMSLW